MKAGTAGDGQSPPIFVWIFAGPALLPVFQAQQVTKIYEMGEVQVQALRGVDLDLYEGEFVVLLGPSGSGKSTLLNILGGLDVPSGGTVRYLDHDLTRFDDAALTAYRRQHVGFVFQFYNLIPSLTARENVALITEIARDPMPPEEALELVGPVAAARSFPCAAFRWRAAASGDCPRRGETSRRAAVRRTDRGAWMRRPESSCWRRSSDVNRELGTTTAVITHNAVIADMADRVISLFDGRVVKVRRNTHKTAARDLQW